MWPYIYLSGRTYRGRDVFENVERYHSYCTLILILAFSLAGLVTIFYSFFWYDVQFNSFWYAIWIEVE